MARKLYDEFGERIFGEDGLEDELNVIAASVSRVPSRSTALMDNRPRYPVTVVYPRGPQLLRGPSKAVAPITGMITKVEIWWQGGLVTSVLAGDNFDVKVYFDVSNPGGGNWTIAATAVRTDGSGDAHMDLYSVFNSTHQIDSFLIQDAASVNAPFVMPAQATAYRINLWAYPYAWPSGKAGFLTSVPQSQW